MRAIQARKKGQGHEFLVQTLLAQSMQEVVHPNYFFSPRR
jgi:hypothetical protein